MAMNLPPVLRQIHRDANGNPLAGGKIYTYQAGTTTPQPTYTDQGGLTPNANPIVLDANGEAPMWLDPSLSYKFVVTDSAGVVQWTTDSVVGILIANAVSTAAIQDGAVTAVKLASACIDIAKLDTSTTYAASDIRNLGLAASVASNALSIAVKDAAGNDPSASSPVRAIFRSSTLTSGSPVVRSLTAALSITIPSSATLGSTNGNANTVHAYWIDNGGTGELAVSGSKVAEDGTLVSTTAISAAATSRFVLYSASARSNVACRYLGLVKSTQATAGTWATGPSEIRIAPFNQGKTKNEWVFDTGLGAGSTDTKIRRYTNVTSTGVGGTAATNATNGATFTVTEDDYYTHTIIDANSGAAAAIGLSRNSTELTTSAFSITASSKIALGQSPGAAVLGGICVRVWHNAGEVIRHHGGGTVGNDTSGDSKWIITRG